VIEALRSRLAVRRVYLARSRTASAIARLAERRGVAIEWVPVATLSRLASGGHHQGAVAEAATYAYASLPELIGGPGRGVVLLDGIQDPRNLGAILRTARAASVQGVILSKHGTVGVTSTVVAASAGVALHLPVTRVTSLGQAMATLKDAGYWLVGLAADADRRLDELDRIDRVALILGAEGSGLRPLVRRRCDFVAGIPMDPSVESLNVSVAAGIALYELLLRAP